MTQLRRYTSDDLERLDRKEGYRYEIVDGELHVSTAPDWNHQAVCGRLYSALASWSLETGAGAAGLAPGVIFGEDDDVAPDVVWVSRARLTSLDAAGHLRAAPELVVEVLSPGRANERRDREAKLALYARRGVDEYWIVDRRAGSVDGYRRGAAGLALVATLGESDALESPLLPGFRHPVAALFRGLPRRD